MKSFYISSLIFVLFTFTFFILTIEDTKFETADTLIEKPIVLADKIVLPIEILGEEGLVISQSIELNAQTVNIADRLWLTINNLSYQNKGSVKINEGAWLQLNHNTAEIHPKELAYGGMVHGGFNTIRLTIPANGLQEGTNTIQFRFDTSDGISIGYRVIKMNLIDSNNTRLLAESSFIEDTPSNWTAPDNSSVQNGENLWYNKDLWNHYTLNNNEGFWYGKTIPNRRTIRAKCTDCHTQDGRDLEMFSYSNLSIIERSKFHGMTEQEGKDIAAYIRSLSSNSTVGRYGRPWNPPYQPGPILKDIPIVQWAAGAGLEWVLENDADMAPYIFTNGTSKIGIRSVFDSDKMEDRTILPLAIQFPDWKHWLPIIHPKDAYTKNEWWNNTLPDAQNPIKNYQAIRSQFTNNYNPSTIESFNVPQKLRYLGIGLDGRTGFRYFYQHGASNTNHWRSDEGNANQHLANGIDLEMAKTSMARLQAVKYFELVNEFNLQDKAPQTVPNVEEDQPLERQWPVKWYSVFEVPAHFTSDNSRHYVGQEHKTAHYETSTWYNLQFVINGGNGFVGGTNPTDFNYHTPFMGFAEYYSGINEPLRRFSAINHMYQIRTWSGNNGPENEGFRISNQGIWEMMGSSNSNQEFHDPSYDIVKQLDNIEAGLSDKVLEAMLLQFLNEAEKYDLSTWPRTADGGDYQLDFASKTTTDLISVPHFGNPNQGRLLYHYADKFYDIIPRIKDNFTVHCSITNRITNWCKAAWPLIDFEKYLISNCSDEVLDCDNTVIEDENIYRIKTTHGKCINAIESNGYAITQQSCNDSSAGKWNLENADTGYYYIKNIETGKYMSTTGNTNGDHIEEAAFSGNDSQQWEIKEIDGCKFNIIAKTSSKCLDLKGGNSADGTHFQLWDCVNTNSQNREYSFEFLETEVLEIEDLSISNMVLYPNPAHTLLNIEIPNKHFSKPIQIKVYDFMGRSIKEVTSKEDLIKINLDNIPLGNYFILLLDDKKSYNSFFIKN
ncbi:RICIN domain-containing protein [uncultured Aquimarina sp.]|uniref:RICIN domain-containing protein n=1 Tax=uncultured Aquimarina sp. TaxID=575652 RepID=UPI002617CAEA|nr:RICIN domain-containing protein [uncultured Aquimarina sp.]